MKKIPYKIAIIYFWTNFYKKHNIFIDNWFSDYELIDDIHNADIVFVGSCLRNENDYNNIKNINNCKKILFISEPIYKYSPFTYKLYIENVFDMVIGSINEDIRNNKYKYPFL